jgi:hypothetical protein
MPKSNFRNMIGIAIAAAAAVSAGCERPSAGKAGHLAQAVMLVEVVKPERHTVQRSVGEPGQLEAYETTPIHAKIAGYVRTVNTDIGYEIKSAATSTPATSPGPGPTPPRCSSRPGPTWSPSSWTSRKRTRPTSTRVTAPPSSSRR